MNINSSYFKISKEILNALNNNKPIVALETAIITHGMPYPENYNLTINLKRILKNKGVIPAVIGLIKGKIIVGLSNEEIKYLSTEKNLFKFASKDIGYGIIKKLSGGTTVSGTMTIASNIGIKVFATGGIGGVHKNFGTELDISSDLIEFTKSDVIVISAGCKSILDIPKTVELLETLGISVIGYKTNFFPAFFSRKSNVKIDLRLDTPEEITNFYKIKCNLGNKQGILIVNPVPENDEIPYEEIEAYINEAYKEMKNLPEDIYKGKNLTPYLLSKIVELSNGKTLKTNISLVKNNVNLAAEIALKLHKM